MAMLPPCPSAPEWMHCDVLACQVLEEASREISAKCKALGDALQGVCHDALERLPAEDGDKISGTEFISTFSHFSTALLAVAGDLEIIVSQPLQQVIATLLEESSGRAKHLQQVKKRFSELQEKYGKAQQKTMEAKSKLASGDRRWWRKSSKSAVDQHAAVCDLARCEEELLESEASLRKLEDESRERLAQLDMDKRAMLQRVLQQGRSSLRRLLRVADEVPPLEDFQGVMPGADYFACLKEEPQESPDLDDDMDSSTGHDMPVELERKDSLTDRFAKYLPGPDLEEEECEVDVEVSASSRAAGWSPESTSSRKLGARQGSLVFESDASKVLIKTQPREFPERSQKPPGGAATNPVVEASESETEDQEDLGDLETLAPSQSLTLELSPLVSEHPQQSFEAYVKRVPELLAAAVETNWEKLQAAAADHPLGSLVGKLELFWIHEPGSVKAEAVGLVCFQFVQGHASHYVRILHLSVTKSEALQAAVSQARSFILETLPVKSLRVTVLAAEDDAQHICIDPQVESAYHQCGFRWFQLTQKLRRKKAALLRNRKKKTLRFLVLHSQRTEEDPPAPRNEIGTKALLLLQSQTSEEPSAAKESPTGDQTPGDELTFSSW